MNFQNLLEFLSGFLRKGLKRSEFLLDGFVGVSIFILDHLFLIERDLKEPDSPRDQSILVLHSELPTPFITMQKPSNFYLAEPGITLSDRDS